jgi:AraC-like DNA-binding protein
MPPNSFSRPEPRHSPADHAYLFENDQYQDPLLSGVSWRHHNFGKVETQAKRAKMDKTDRSRSELQYSVSNRPSISLVSEDQLIPLLIESAERNEAALAASLGYSTTQFRRICLSELGEPIGSFIRRARLERAAGRLALDQTSISEIGKEAGYLSEEAFSKAFRRHFDCSPSMFREFNQTADCLLPGYLISRGLRSRLPKAVKIAVGESQTARFIYDGPVFLARILPSGVIDWIPR